MAQHCFAPPISIRDAFKKGIEDALSGSNQPRGNLLRKIASIKWRQHYEAAETYFYSLNCRDKILQIKQLNGDDRTNVGTGASVWPCAVVLSKYLESHFKDGMDDFHVIDLGSGTGIVGLVAAYLGASAILTDLPQLHSVLQHNIIANKLENCCAVINYKWGDENTGLIPKVNSHIIITGSDCVVPQLFPLKPLVDAIYQLSTATNLSCTTLLSVEQRTYIEFDPKQEFQRLLHECGNFHFRTIDYVEFDPLFYCEDIEIWEITKLNST